MTFAIITHVDHIIEDSRYYGYAPYVKEMNLWAKNVDEMIVVAPASNRKISSIETAYKGIIDFYKVPAISLTSISEAIKAMVYFPGIFYTIFRAMNKADHIHLRCPGNIGLIGCLVQIFFPKKPKTAKYAGNWDPKAKQPLSYRFQKWLLSNKLLTRNMHVLVYGEWPDQTKNIKSFFTATYPKSKVPVITTRSFKQPYRFMFVGGLTIGKRPLYAIQLIEKLHDLGNKVSLDIYGDGSERVRLEEYIKAGSLSQIVSLHGNQSSERVEEAYMQSDFLILPSRSEGWPKAVAEAMFWGVVPIVTSISCVPWMLGYGERGILINIKIEDDSKLVGDLLQYSESLIRMSVNGQKWSHQYTLDDFENEIKKLMK